MEEITTRSGEVFEVTTEALTPFKATGKTVNEIASNWENTPMSKFEIVKHFVEHLKLDEEILARETEETKRWQHDTLALQKQNKMVWEIVDEKVKEISDLQEKINNIKYLLDCGKHEIPKFCIDILTQSLGA